MKLQLFAEGDTTGADQGEGGGAGNKPDEGSSGGADTRNKEPKSFDELLQNNCLLYTSDAADD